MFAFVLAAAAAAPSTDHVQYFRDWAVGCDNGRVCQAVGLLPPGDWEAATVAVRRGPEPQATPEIGLIYEVDGKASAILADGKRLDLTLRTDDKHVSVEGSGAARLLEALRSAHSMRLVDASGKSLGAISVSGASAAFRYMDEQQKRVGTVTALVAKGSKPASAVPTSAALPVVDVTQRSAKPPKLLNAAQLRKLRAPCPKENDPGLVSHHRLDANNSLALVTLVCVSGAYNMATEVLIVPDNGPVRPAAFEWRKSEEETLFNVEWDEQSRRLETYFKGRGIGDCGSIQRYAWDGRRFRLVEASHMGECRGAREFIRTFQARVVERR